MTSVSLEQLHSRLIKQSMSSCSSDSRIVLMQASLQNQQVKVLLAQWQSMRFLTLSSLAAPVLEECRGIHLSLLAMLAVIPPTLMQIIDMS